MTAPFQATPLAQVAYDPDAAALVHFASGAGSRGTAVSLGGAVTVVAGAVASAAANTLAIQTALTAGGLVTIYTPGVIYINTRLIYGSNTRLILGPLTTICAVPGMNDTLLNSLSAEAFVNNSGGAAVTLTQGTGCAVNVQWAGHGRSVNDGVWLSGSTLSTYNGVFRVQSIVDANNLVVFTTHYAVSAPSGSAKAVVAVSNFHFEGGIWDYDYANNQGAPSTWKAHAVNLTGLLDSSARYSMGVNGNKYAFCICATENFEYSSLRSNNRSDGIKIYGPCRTLRGDGASGVTSDDFLSIQTKEGPSFIALQLSSGGDIYDVEVRGFDNYQGTASGGIILYPSDAELMDRLTIDGVSGSNNTLSIVTDGVNFLQGNIGQLTVRNFNATIGVQNQAGITVQRCNIDKFTVEGGSWWPGSSLLANNNNYLSTATTTTIGELVIRGLNVHGVPADTSAAVLSVCNLSGTFRKITVEAASAKAGVGNTQFLNFLSTFAVDDILIKDSYADSSVKYLVQFASAPTNSPRITLDNNTLDSIGVIQAVGAFSGDVVLGGNKFNNCNFGIVRHGGSGAVRVMSKGGNQFTTTPIIVTFGSATFTAWGNDLVYDAGLLATTKGQYLSHASAVAGRNAANQQGPCVGVDGTHFYALGTGASGANTLIV